MRVFAQDDADRKTAEFRRLDSDDDSTIVPLEGGRALAPLIRVGFWRRSHDSSRLGGGAECCS